MDTDTALAWLVVGTALVQFLELVFGAVTRARAAWQRSPLPGPPAPPLVDPRMNGDRRRNPSVRVSDDRRKR